MNLPGYDEWKLDSGYDYPTPLAEARAEIRLLEDENAMLINQHDKLVNALDECLDWFEERQDVVDGPEGPNSEMRMAWKLKELLK